MFERFTTQSRQIVVQAQQEAIDLHHPTVGTQHLLLAMTRLPGAAGSVLTAAGLTPDDVCASVRKLSATPQPLLTVEEMQALRSVGIDVDAVLARIEQSFGPEALLAPSEQPKGWLRRTRRQGGFVIGHLRFTPRSKKVLELSLREAIRLKDRQISSGHLLLGLLREGEGAGAQILVQAGLDLAALRAQTEQALRAAA